MRACVKHSNLVCRPLYVWDIGYTVYARVYARLCACVHAWRICIMMDQISHLDNLGVTFLLIPRVYKKEVELCIINYIHCMQHRLHKMVPRLLFNMIKNGT